MVTDFLRKYQDQLLEKRDTLKEELNNTEIEIRKQEKFIEAISEDVSEPFSAFSPHTTDRTKQNRIDEQNDKMDQLQIQRTQLDQEIQRLDDEIVEVERSLQEVNREKNGSTSEAEKSEPENTSETEIMSFQNHDDTQSTDQRPENSNVDNSIDPDILRQIKNAKDFLPADPMRARDILETLLKKYGNAN